MTMEKEINLFDLLYAEQVKEEPLLKKGTIRLVLYSNT